MSRDALAVMDGGKCILQLRGVRPCLSDKYDLPRHPDYKLTGEYDKKNMFDIEKYLHHRLRLLPVTSTSPTAIWERAAPSRSLPAMWKPSVPCKPCRTKTEMPHRKNRKSCSSTSAGSVWQMPLTRAKTAGPNRERHRHQQRN